MNESPTLACRCCNAPSAAVFSGMLLGRRVAYFECSVCGYVQSEEPYWLDEAYKEAINVSDTGIVARNQSNAQIVLATLVALRKLSGTVVDCAGGYGLLVRMLRDFGVDALWSDQYCQNLVARGFEHQGQKADLVTGFEVLEHYVSPMAELDRLLTVAPNILLSTEIMQHPTPKPEEWWYYGQEHGQHIGFFRIKTLEHMAKSRGKYFISNGTSYHLISDEPVNPVLWRSFMRMNRLMPFYVRRRLKSRIRPDNTLMAGLKK